MKEKLNWRRPFFYLVLPIFFVMAFLGFPLPLAPPPTIRPPQEQAEVIKKRKKRIGLVAPGADSAGDRGQGG